jgi:hypothetical protein
VAPQGRLQRRLTGSPNLITSMQAHAEARSTRRKRNLLLLNLSAPPRLRVSIPTRPASAHPPPPPPQAAQSRPGIESALSLLGTHIAVR